MIVAYCRCRDDSPDVVAQAFKIGAMVALCRVCGGAVPGAARAEEDSEECAEDDLPSDSNVLIEAYSAMMIQAGLVELGTAMKSRNLRRVAEAARILYDASHGEDSKRDGGGYTKRFNADGTIIECKWGGGGGCIGGGGAGT